MILIIFLLPHRKLQERGPGTPVPLTPLFYVNPDSPHIRTNHAVVMGFCRRETSTRGKRTTSEKNMKVSPQTQGLSHTPRVLPKSSAAQEIRMFSEIKHSHFMCSRLRVRLSLRSTRYQYGSHMFYLSTKFNQQVYFKENNSAIPSNTAHQALTL